MDEFLTQVAKLKNDMLELDTYCIKLDKLTKTIGTSVMKAEDEQLTKKKIIIVEQDFKKTSMYIKSKLEEMEKANQVYRNEKSELDSSFEYEARNSHLQGMTKQLANACDKYRAVQVRYKNSEEQKTKSQYKIEYPNLDSDEIVQKIKQHEEQGVDKVFGEVSSSAKSVYNKAEQRNKEVKKISDNICELCILIDELHDMVKGESGKIDKIEVHAAASVAATGRGNKSLKNAYDYQVSATRIKRIIIAIASIIVLVLLGYAGFKIFGGRSSSGGNNNKQKGNDNENN
ncbi:Syntaxin-1A [Conglomerata obtusa]